MTGLDNKKEQNGRRASESLSGKGVRIEDMSRGELLLVMYAMLELQKGGLTDATTRVLEKTIAQLEKEGLTEEKKTKKENM